jgi:hypothetical protein
MMPEPGPRPLPSIEELTDTSPDVSPDGIRDSMMHQMGLAPNPVQRPPEHPGIRELREGLGI